MFNLIHCHQQCISAKTVISCVLKALLKLSRSEPSLNICIVSAALITHLAQCRNHKLFVTSLRDIEKALVPWEAVNVLTKLLSEYYEFASLFFWEKSDKLSSYCSYDHIILLISDKELSKEPLYNMSHDELQVLQKYLKDYLSKDFICVSSSLITSSVIFVKKSEDELCLCMNYHDLKNLTVKNQYLLPLIQETLNLMISSVIFFFYFFFISSFSVCSLRLWHFLVN